MRIKKIVRDKPRKISAVIAEPIYRELLEYCQMYEEVHGDRASLQEVAGKVIEALVSSDRDFRHWKHVRRIREKQGVEVNKQDSNGVNESTQETHEQWLRRHGFLEKSES